MEIIKRQKINKKLPPESCFYMEFDGKIMLEIPLEEGYACEELFAFKIKEGDFGIKNKEGVGGTFIFTKKK